MDDVNCILCSGGKLLNVTLRVIPHSDGFDKKIVGSLPKLLHEDTTTSF